MRVFAIGDTHLSRSRHKPMDIFGPHWANHEERIRDNWNTIGADDDLLLIAGDISWALRPEDAMADLRFLAEFRGQKLLLRGNHDYWWGSLSKARSLAPPGIQLLQNDSFVFGDIAIAGTRGWTSPSVSSDASDVTIYSREVDRLRLSLATLRSREYRTLVCMTHYPPLSALEEETPISALVEAARASVCVFGHLHGADIQNAAEGERNGVRYKLVSSDAVGFTPWQAWPPLADTSEADRLRAAADHEAAPAPTQSARCQPPRQV